MVAMGLAADRLGGRGGQRFGSSSGVVVVLLGGRGSDGLGSHSVGGSTTRGASSLAVPWRLLDRLMSQREEEDIQWSPWGSQPTDSVGEGARSSVAPAEWSKVVVLASTSATVVRAASQCPGEMS